MITEAEKERIRAALAEADRAVAECARSMAAAFEPVGRALRQAAEEIGKLKRVGPGDTP